MPGRPRRDRSTVKGHFVGVRLTDGERKGLDEYLTEATGELESDGFLGASLSSASVVRQALRAFLRSKGIEIDPRGSVKSQPRSMKRAQQQKKKTRRGA